MLIKVIRWMLFSVSIALVPLFFNYFSLKLRGFDVDVQQIIQNGELMLIIAAMSAAAIGELVGSSGQARILKVVAGGSSTLLLMLAALYYADVASLRFSGSMPDADSVAMMSFALFGLAVVSGGSCIALSEA